MNEAMSEFMGTSEEIRLTVANAGYIFQITNKDEKHP